MRQLRCAVVLLFVGLLPAAVLAQANNFNADSAYAYTKYLSDTIGPRPMGSENERAALQWSVNRFLAFGADSAYVMRYTSAKSRGRGMNTNSGVAVGVFNGEVDSSIVIGGHIDSAGRDIPGANDDASGTACVIELARLWSQQPRRYTLVFTAFGGEEQGLIGSNYFVDHYSRIDDVALMLQIDMAGTEGDLVTLIDTKSRQAPKWLVQDAFAFDRSLGFGTLGYPTHFLSISNPVDAIGSDHEPFLEKDIPAIDFTAGMNKSPIHTPQDKIAFISKPALDHSGRLVNALLTKYQEEGIPAPRDGNYMLWQVFGNELFIPSWMTFIAVALSVAVGIWAFLYSRNHRLKIEKSERIRFSGTKLFLVMILIAVFTQLGETVMQLIKGLRYPWFVPVGQYLWFALIWSIAGIWTGLQLTRRWRFSPDPYVYTKRAFIVLFIFTILLAAASPRLAFYPAATLLLFGLAILIPNSALRLILTVLAPLPMFRLMFNEILPLFARTWTLSGLAIDHFWEALLFSAILTAVLVIWYLPAIYLYSYAIVMVQPFKKILKGVRTPAFGLVILLAVFGYGGYLYSLPAYNEMWRAALRVNAEYDIGTGENKLRLLSNEYFRNVTVKSDSLDKHYDQRIHQDELPVSFTANWLNLSGNETVTHGERDSISIDWTLSSLRPWYRTTLKLQADTLEIGDLQSDLTFNHKADQASFVWFADPPQNLHVTADFTLSPGARLIREVSAVYPELPVSMQVTAELADVRYQTRVTYRDTLTFNSTAGISSGQ